MAPKIVDRNKKRLEIIEKTFFYLTEKGLSNFSLDSLLRHLSISKGNFYHYFESKDELIHCLMDELTLKYIQTCNKKLNEVTDLKNKFEILFEVYIKESNTNKDFLKLYNEFLLIYSNRNKDKISELNNKYQEYLNTIIKNAINEEIKKGLIKKESIFLVNSIGATIDGMLLYSFILDDFNLSDEIKNYLDNLILMIKKD